MSADERVTSDMVWCPSGTNRNGHFHSERECPNFPANPRPRSRIVAEEWGYDECIQCQRHRDGYTVDEETSEQNNKGGECPFCGDDYPRDLPSHLRGDFDPDGEGCTGVSGPSFDGGGGVV